MIRFLFAVVIVLSLFGVPLPLQAQDQLASQSATQPATQSAIIVAPTFQEIVLTASDSAVPGTVTINNQTNQEQLFEVFAVAISQIDSEGRITLSDKPLSGSNDPFSADVEIPQPLVTVTPSQKLDVPFVVKNSLNLSPGGHYVSLIIRSKSEQRDQPAAQSVLPAISSFLVIRKMGGEQYNLFLKELRFPRGTFWWKLPNQVTLTFENQGNIHTIPRGQVLISDVFGRVVTEGTINEGSQFVLPRSQRDIRVQLRQIRPSFPLMVYKISAKGTSDLGNAKFEQTAFSGYASWQAIAAAPLMIILGITWYVLRKKRHEKNSGT